MDILSTVSLEGIFSALNSAQAQRASLSKSAMSSGARRLQEQRYDEAIQEFKRAAALQPDSSDPHVLMGRTYRLLGQTSDAIAAFEKAVKLDPGSVDAREYLAGSYVAAQRYGDAEVQYKEAIKLDGTDAAPHSALGSLYLLMGRYAEAETQFQTVGSMTPLDAGSYNNLGLVYNKQERYAEAVKQFERAIALEPGNVEAHAELAYSYLGLGFEDRATDQATLLWNMDTNESWTRAAEIESAMLTPQMQYADTAKSTFNPFLLPGASLSLEDSSLATPGASKVFTMVFRFNQPMDLSSVQSLTNWSIGKAAGGAGGVFDNGVTLDYGREVDIMPLPLAVAYDPDTREATVYFRVTQNAAGDGVIDPQHWVFKFSGTDVNGNPMDSRGDEYDGFARKPY